MNVLFIDNFDSFTFNLVDEFAKRDCKVLVYRNNTPMKKILQVTKDFKPNLIVISPGPSTPKQAGNSIPIIKKFAGKIPIFGVCLGHQAIIEAFKGKVEKCAETIHGKPSKIEHDEKTIFVGLENKLQAGRYHSLCGTKIPACLEISAKTNNIVMAVRHKAFSETAFVEGVQFHPESILTTEGGKIIDNLLSMIKSKNKILDSAIVKVSLSKNLSRAETKKVFFEIMQGNASTEKIAFFLKALAEKGETIGEIVGAAESMRSVVAAVKPKVNTELLDIVGTGGDKKQTINVSTASAFVAAGAGCIVAKHGNRSVSSKCGAADVLEKLGVNINSSAEKNSALIEKIGIAFLFAPCHHPAMKFAAPARKQLGIRTIFNILGPLTNPANAQTYLLGVFDLALAEKLARVLSGLKVKHALVVHGNDGCDEISLCDSTTVFEVKGKIVKRFVVSPEQFGFEKCNIQDLVVENPDTAAVALKNVLSGAEQAAKRNIVLLNAGAAIYANNKADSIVAGIEKAKESIDSGKALKKLEELIEASNK